MRIQFFWANNKMINTDWWLKESEKRWNCLRETYTKLVHKLFLDFEKTKAKHWPNAGEVSLLLPWNKKLIYSKKWRERPEKFRPEFFRPFILLLKSKHQKTARIIHIHFNLVLIHEIHVFRAENNGHLVAGQDDRPNQC